MNNKDEPGRIAETLRHQNIQKIWWEKRGLLVFEGQAHSKNLKGFRGFERVVSTVAFKIFESTENKQNISTFQWVSPYQGSIYGFRIQKF